MLIQKIKAKSAPYPLPYVRMSMMLMGNGLPASKVNDATIRVLNELDVETSRYGHLTSIHTRPPPFPTRTHHSPLPQVQVRTRIDASTMALRPRARSPSSNRHGAHKGCSKDERRGETNHHTGWNAGFRTSRRSVCNIRRAG